MNFDKTHQEFSFRSRAESIKQMQAHEFDMLIIGGGITGAAVARDAAMRGLKVALVEKSDFAQGTSSRSSKLAHGGFRYLENYEFGLVFESLSERTQLLKNVPEMVKPLRFYFPVYKTDKHSVWFINLGMWFYDILALFRAPGLHKRMSKKRLLKDIPFLKSKGLKGGFRYYDASMWDDVLTVEIMRDAHLRGAEVASYVEAKEPIFENEKLAGFKIKDHESGNEFEVRAKKTVICAGPWTDIVGRAIDKNWKSWLQPSKGVHLIFDLKKIPIPGALVMAHPDDGRISFAIPRKDMGKGVVIVGTTDGSTPKNPDKAEVEKADIEYLMELLNRYFPDLGISEKDILSAYVGVRPLLKGNSADLQKVSREHKIAEGPGGSVVVAGGKYTTHRTMAQEIIDFAFPNSKHVNTKLPIHSSPVFQKDDIESQLRFEIKNRMVIHLEDFLIRRTALFLEHKNFDKSTIQNFAKILIEETGRPPEDIEKETEQYFKEVNRREKWRTETAH